MAFDRRTVIVVGASTAVGFLGDVITYSLAASKQQGKKFSIHFPKGMALFNLIWLGIATGLVIDYAIKKLDESQMTEAERKLNDLVEKEKEKISSGLLTGKLPREIVWA